MRTVIAAPSPELDAWIARRRAMRQDLHDEVWHGEYHMAPAANFWHSIVAGHLTVVLTGAASRCGLFVSTGFNLGRHKDDVRVPDLGVHRSLPNIVWVPTAAMVVEVVSPGDESWSTFDHYATHGVDEVLIADPEQRTLDLFVLTGGRYEPRDHSGVLDVAVAELHAAIGWPGPPAPPPPASSA